MRAEIDKSIRELSSKEMAAHRNCVHSEARERIGEVGGALRVALNNLVVGSLREYIALSRHQLEMSEYINIHTGGSDDPDDLWIQKIHWPDLRYYPFQVARRPVEQNEKALPPIWAVEQLRDLMWRVKAVGSVLGRSGKHLVATDADGITELSNHQCEIADFLKTGKFKKVPRRRKARYLGGDGTQSAETAERVRELGEALKEYQGRIEIKTVREFIALSKHQCELAGMVIASEREMSTPQRIDAHGYTETCGEAVGSNSSCSDSIGASRDSFRSKATALDTPVKPEYDVNECRASSPSGPKSYMNENPDRSGNGPYIRNMPYESVPLDPQYTYDLPRVPFYTDGTIPLPVDGRWVRVDTPDGPMAMRMLNPQHLPEQEYYDKDDVWDDDYWDEEWGDDP